MVLCAGRMLIEKLMSGLYMGEAARRILLSFARHASLFDGVVPQKLTEANSFVTAGAPWLWDLLLVAGACQSCSPGAGASWCLSAAGLAYSYMCQAN